MRLSIGRIIRHVDGIVIIDDCLDAIAAVQGRIGTDVQIAAIDYRS
jgi:hypothetical protein